MGAGDANYLSHVIFVAPVSARVEMTHGALIVHLEYLIVESRLQREVVWMRELRGSGQFAGVARKWSLSYGSGCWLCGN